MSVGKILILVGVVLIVLGVLWTANIQIPWLGKLPGDITIKKENFSFYFPITTCILISLILSLLVYLFRR